MELISAFSKAHLRMAASSFVLLLALAALYTPERSVLMYHALTLVLVILLLVAKL